MMKLIKDINKEVERTKRIKCYNILKEVFNMKRIPYKIYKKEGNEYKPVSTKEVIQYFNAKRRSK